MSELLPGRFFADPIRAALASTHQHLAIGGGLTRRYPADVAPFATLSEQTEAAVEMLRALLAPGETIWLFGADFPVLPGLDFTNRMVCPQMALPDHVEPPGHRRTVRGQRP
jgi:hypothetical protein